MTMKGSVEARKAALPPLRGSPGVSDVLLASGVVAIIGLMILPVPLLAIDSLVAVNVLFGVGLVLLAIYIPAPTAFASFPSVLLLTTLFRLSLVPGNARIDVRYQCRSGCRLCSA
jgi:type III secretory pathway component EscV